MILRPDLEQEKMLESIKAHMETLVFDGKVRKSMIEYIIQYMSLSYDIIVLVDVQVDAEGY